MSQNLRNDYYYYYSCNTEKRRGADRRGSSVVLLLLSQGRYLQTGETKKHLNLYRTLQGIIIILQWKGKFKKILKWRVIKMAVVSPVIHYSLYLHCHKWISLSLGDNYDEKQILSTIKISDLWKLMFVSLFLSLSLRCFAKETLAAFNSTHYLCR